MQLHALPVGSVLHCVCDDNDGHSCGGGNGGGDDDDNLFASAALRRECT